jgi:hypothetical protein
MADGLFIKFKSDDTGARPVNPCGAPNYVWNSPSITMTNKATGATMTDAVVGTTSVISVVVNNKASEGKTFTPNPQQGLFVNVQVWVSNPSMGIGPAGGLASAGGAAGRVGFVPTALAPGGSGIATVEWGPVSGDFLNVTNGKGHLCITANCYWEGPGAEGAEMGSSDPINVCANQHHGWKNISILPMGRAPIIFKVLAWNIARTEREFVIEAKERRGAGVLGRVEREILLAQPFVKLAGGSPRQDLRIRGRRIESFRNREGVLILPEPIERAMLRGGGKLVLSGRQATPIALARAPLEDIEISTPRPGGGGGEPAQTRVRVAPRRAKQVVVELQANNNDRPGATRVIDMVQRTQQGRLIGAFRIVTVFSPPHA